MTLATRPELVRYLGGLACTFAGAWAAGETGSMLPLAMGGAVAVMATLPLVGALWRGRWRGERRRSALRAGLPPDSRSRRE